MTLKGTCHCGAVTIEVPQRPETVTDCNCSLCRRYGVLWAYFLSDTVRVTSTVEQASHEAYAWGARNIDFQRCRGCGCVTHYTRVKSKNRRTYVGVNARMFELELLEQVPVRKLDGARKWRAVIVEPQYAVLAPATPPAAAKGVAETRKAGAKAVGAKKAGAKKAGAKKAGATKAGATKAGATKAGATKVGATKAGATKVGSKRAGATKAGATKAGATKVGATKVGANKASATKASATKANATKASAKKPGAK